MTITTEGLMSVVDTKPYFVGYEGADGKARYYSQPYSDLGFALGVADKFNRENNERTTGFRRPDDAKSAWQVYKFEMRSFRPVPPDGYEG